MKKQLNLSAADKKLSLSKRTISNLSSCEMNRVAGGIGNATALHTCDCDITRPGHTKNGNTCPGHNTCYNC